MILLARIFNEATMGFLALAALAAALVPLLFDVGAGAMAVLDVAEWVVVAAFAIEYLLRYATAPDRRRFFLDPWNLLDLVIVVAPLLSLLPQVSDLARSSPVLRVLRLARIIVFGARAGSSLRRAAAPAAAGGPAGPLAVAVLRPGEPAPVAAAWEDVLRWAGRPSADWMHVSNIPRDRLAELAAATGVSRGLIESALHDSSFPRLETGPRWSALTLWMPQAQPRLQRDPVLLLVSGEDLLSLAPGAPDLMGSHPADEALPWGVRCTLGVIRRHLSRYEDLAGRLEADVRGLEMLRADDSPESFFEEVFRLKRDLGTAKGDLWRLRGILGQIADGRRKLLGLDGAHRGAFRELAEETDWLHETVDGVRETLLSLLDLHINVAAHETNRFMRLLAIVSTLALIPAVLGGLLGMNLADSPWTVTLGQVAFGALMTMLAALYLFLAKGWIR